MNESSPSKEQLEILWHTLGIRPEMRDPYRNHYVAGYGHHAMDVLTALVTLGLMAIGKTPAFCDAKDIVFYCTEAGKTVAIENLPDPVAEKKSNYREFINADCGHSFAEFLGINKPSVETRRVTGAGKWGYKYEYRMCRIPPYWREDINAVYGEWAPTKKTAKASYKAALKKSKGRAV